MKKFATVCIIATFLQIITAAYIGRAVNNAVYGSPLSTLAVENAYGPNVVYTDNVLAYNNIVNGINGPANPHIYANSIYGSAHPPAYDGIVNGVYGPAGPIAYDGVVNGVYGPVNEMALDDIVNGIYGPSNTVTVDKVGYGLSAAKLAASNGAGFSVRSKSPIAIKGISVESENMVIEGPLFVNGQLPFLGTVGMEGDLPVAGDGAVLYKCGDGNVAMLNEKFPATALSSGYGYNGMPTSNYGPTVAGTLGKNILPYGGFY
ncbi:unnamed protein product [Euphydryas editha]|uniref:Uncharacterized protein n=1 Tax=Euphydryas editha TaxID=104508 RepID=A0AAU9TBP9_EUPED|nr:unnamed protein product [Euphydryas editha]